MAMTDKTEAGRIEAFLRTWAGAVHDGDLAAVLANHDDAIVMFDVPPPQEGVRGMAAYRETWPGFFTWQASGARFDLQELEVTAGTDVAFAWALLICATPDEIAAEPEKRLRLTVGLVRKDDRWVVTHEHHSFADG